MNKKILEIKDKIQIVSTLSKEQLQQDSGARNLFTVFCSYLNIGTIRSAEKNNKGIWQVNTWVKEGILLGMNLGEITIFSKESETLQFSDKNTLPLQQAIELISKNIRIVPGGTSIRTGAYIGDRVIIMPPAYINIGAYVDEATMIDSHALVGSCAQIGKRCHISAGVQIGGVLEPITAQPCIVEDDVMMGIQSAIAEGVILSERVVVGAGVIITSSTPVYDLVHKTIYTFKNGSLIIPKGAVIIPGSRQKKGNSFSEEHGLSITTPIIVKYRDEKTNAKTALEGSLR